MAVPYQPDYVALASDQLGSHTVEYCDDPGAFIVSGPCPRCGHTTSDDAIPSTVLLPEVETAPPVTIKAPLPPPAPPPLPGPRRRPFLRVCDCDYLHLDHDNKPGSGCGARWALVIEGATSSAMLALPTDGPALTMTDQRAADAAIDGALTQARGTAEKWRNALAGFSGLVATFLILAGVTDVAKSPAAPAIVWFGLLGLGCAVLAAYVAATAAIGNPVEFRTHGEGDAAAIKVERMRQARYAGERLQAAKVLTVAAGFFLVLATLYTYMPPKAEAPQLSITLENAQATVCGVPTKGSGDLIVITTAGGQRIEVPMSEIKAMEIVGSCD